MAYVTLADFKRYREIDALDTTDDDLLQFFLAAAQSSIDRFCHQTFEALADSARRFDAQSDVDGRMLWFDAPLCAITSVTNGDGSIVAAANYVAEPRNLMPWHAIRLTTAAPLSWTWTTSPENSIVITGKWAYSVAADATIQEVTKRLTAYYYGNRDSTLSLDQQMQSPNSVVALAEMPKDVQAILKQGGYYRML